MRKRGESLELELVLPVSPAKLYTAWLSSKTHAAFTGGAAVIEPGVGGRFSAWDGYIEGTNLELEPKRRIRQSWRTADFGARDPDSELELLFESRGAGTRLRLIHRGLPRGGAAKYSEGWVDFYFTPMKAYYAKAASRAKATPKRKAR